MPFYFMLPCTSEYVTWFGFRRHEQLLLATMRIAEVQQENSKAMEGQARAISCLQQQQGKVQMSNCMTLHHSVSEDARDRFLFMHGNNLSALKLLQKLHEQQAAKTEQARVADLQQLSIKQAAEIASHQAAASELVSTATALVTRAEAERDAAKAEIQQLAENKKQLQ
eukprot:scaffold62091_cov22-Tisochrysis_lutea.AAC.1